MRNLILLLFVFPFLSWAQVEQARMHVEKLCSPDFHGRGYVKNGDKIAAEYIAEQFAEIGCSTVANGPFQEFQFPVNAFPGRMSFSINDKKYCYRKENICHLFDALTGLMFTLIFFISSSSKKGKMRYV